MQDNQIDNSSSTSVEARPVETPKKDRFWWFVLLIFVIFIPIRLFVAEPFLVYGSSMEPNFQTGDYLIVDEFTYKVSTPQRGDVIVLHPPIAGDENTYFIKRIIGLPGETVIVANGKVTIKNAAHPNGFTLDEKYDVYPSDRTATYTLTSTQYFVMGDNRPVSDDSRNWGPLEKNEIGGKVLLRIYPFNEPHLFPGSLSQFGLNSSNYEQY